MIKKIGGISNYIVERSSHLLMVISGVMVFLMAWVITYGVIMRYAFNSPNPWVYEICTIFLLFCGVFAAPAVERIDRHIKNDILITRFHPVTQHIFLQLIIPLLALPCCVLLTWKGWTNAAFALRIGQVTASSCAVPTAPIKFVIPVCYGLLCLVVIGEIINGVVYINNLLRKRQKE